MRAVVIGAGIGGLAAAAGLRRAGVDVVVLERSRELRPVGAGISLWANAFTALDALGLGRAVRARTGPAAAALQAGQRSPDGRRLSRTPAAAVAGLGVLHRAELQEVLLAAAGEVWLGVEVTAVSPDGRHVVHSGGREEADLVVAADGIHSGVRASWPGDPGLRYAGYSAWRGVTSRPVDLLGAAGETWGRGLRFGLVPLRDGRVYWFGVTSGPPGCTAPDEHAAAREAFAGWHAPIPAVLAATPSDAVHRGDIMDLAEAPPTFRRGRCVLLGDAAHAMTPDLGQGGGQALEDAATLVRLVGPPAAWSAGELDAALARYDALRRPRTARLMKAARRVGAVAQAGSPLGAGLRDLALRLTPGALAGGPLRRVQAWRPPPERHPAATGT
ncbi:FAD-dependent monooxygenase [Pseudonocardia halophobica]|uniref:FAD-dependent monooxygenase n=1 Tax=Pseudonocardia halophobica TaxID=29401 RepID=UPI003D940FCE